MITDNHIMHAEVFNHIPNQQFSQAKNGKIPSCFNGPAAQRSAQVPSTLTSKRAL